MDFWERVCTRRVKVKSAHDSGVNLYFSINGFKIGVLIYMFSGKKLQIKYLRIISSKLPVKLYCCYGVIMALSVAVVALSVALSGK